MTPADAARLAEIRAGTAGRTHYEGRREPTDEFLLRLLEEVRDERDTLRRALHFCRPRLREAGYREQLDRMISEEPKPPPVGEPGIVRSGANDPPPPEIPHSDAGGSPGDLAQGGER